jgi:hypothetical protein
MAVIHSCKNPWRIFMRHGRNTKARQTRMRGTASGMNHGYKEERISVDCEDVRAQQLALSFFFFFLLSLTMPDLLVKKQSSPKRHSLPFSAVRGVVRQGKKH